MATARPALLFRLLLSLGSLSVPAFALAPQPAQAQGADLATLSVVRGVAVSSAADDPTTARARAIEEGRAEAFRRLTGVIEDPDARARLAKVPPSEVAKLLEGYEIEKETPTAGRYVATVAYRFRPAALRRILDEREAPPVVGNDALVARVSFANFEEWVELRKRIAGAPAVRGFAVRGVNRTEAIVEMKLATTPDQAAQALAARDVALEQDEGGWRLRLGAMKPAPATATPAAPAGAPQSLTPPSLAPLAPPPAPTAPPSAAPTPAPTLPPLRPDPAPSAAYPPAPPLPPVPTTTVAPVFSAPPVPEPLVGAPTPPPQQHGGRGAAAPSPQNEVEDAPPAALPQPVEAPAAPPGFSLGRGPYR